MSPALFEASADPTRPGATEPVTITVDGEPVSGVLGQSIAGVILAADVLRLRDTVGGAPRGVFCGIGVCFDCLVTVNDLTDVRACQRLAVQGDRVSTTTPQDAQSAGTPQGAPSAAEGTS